MKRRNFIAAGLAGTLISGNSAFSKENGVLSEIARDIPVVEEADVIVCGGGPAGFAAAVSAARKGAKTRLIESQGYLGGIMTAGLLCYIMDTRDKKGLVPELLSSLDSRGAGYASVDGDVAVYTYDVEEMKLLLDEKAIEAGVNARFYTQIVGSAVDKSGRLTHVITESKSGREAWAAKAFVDATGDGDLAALSGCGFDLGRKEDGVTQPMSMIAILSGIAMDDIQEFVITGADAISAKKRLLAEMGKAGVTPSYSMPTLMYIRDNLFGLYTNHQYGVKGTSASDLTDATLSSRAEVNKLVKALRCLGGIWKNVRLVATSSHIGVREGRRVHGLYTITETDLANGARFDDAVCRVNFNVDVHAPKKSEGGGYSTIGIKSKPYDIPLRSLISKDVDGLLMAGRCISGDFIAHASYRVNGNAIPLGEAAGKAAAVAALSGKSPRMVKIGEIS